MTELRYQYLIARPQDDYTREDAPDPDELWYPEKGGDIHEALKPEGQVWRRIVSDWERIEPDDATETARPSSRRAGRDESCRA